MKDQEQLFSSEEKHKELVYKTFDQKSSEINKKIKNQETYIQSEAYEDQDSFVVHGALPLIKNKKSKLDHLIGKLYKKPYFVQHQLLPNQYAAHL